VNAEAARHGHDGGDHAGEERRACVGQRQADARRDLVGGPDDDVMIVAREESAAEDRRE
jgi:hypothetical protein